LSSTANGRWVPWIIEAHVKSTLPCLALAAIAFVLGGCGGGGEPVVPPSTSVTPQLPPPVSAPPPGAATLSWTPPTTRADGSPIGRLAGYRILYGPTSGRYERVAAIDNPGISIYVIDGLAPGTWYFAIQSVTSDGLVSAPSEEVSKSI